MQTEVSQLLRFRMSVDRHYSAFVVEFIEHGTLALSYQPSATPPQTTWEQVSHLPGRGSLRRLFHPPTPAPSPPAATPPEPPHTHHAIPNPLRTLPPGHRA